jgi:hypothetical protein
MSRVAYTIDWHYTQNKSISRTAAIYGAFVFGVCVHNFARRPSSVLSPTSLIAIAIAVLETGLLNDVVTAVCLCVLSALLVVFGLECARRPSPLIPVRSNLFPKGISNRRSGNEWRVFLRSTMILLIVILGSRSARAHSWFCRTFRGETEVASIIPPIVIGFTSSVVFSHARYTKGWRRYAVAFASTFSFMSPWHDVERLHGMYLTISYVSANLICAVGGAVQHWLPFFVVTIVSIIVGESEIIENFKQHYVHILLLVVVLTQILVTLVPTSIRHEFSMSSGN